MNYQSILDFWFDEPNSPDYGKEKKEWFTRSYQFDEEIRARFLSTYTQAASGQLDHWHENPSSCLALILLLDQFPRNLFRNTPQAFATDTQALCFAKKAVSQGFDRELLTVQRWFIYLPFEHSENIADQSKSVELFSTLADDPASQTTIEYAYRHLEIIQRFGRFPHRNSILNRPDTEEETKFLLSEKSFF